MLMNLVMALVEAIEPKEKGKAYRNLERVGVDRRTADVMAAEFYEGLRDEIDRENGVKDDGSC